MFLDGKTPSGIAAALTKRGIPTPAGKAKWQASTVKSILSNEKYRGDALLQKTFTVDFLTKKAKVNEGETPQYYVENSHPAIVSAEVFELTQVELARRRQHGRHQYNYGLFRPAGLRGMWRVPRQQGLAQHGCLPKRRLPLQPKVRTEGQAVPITACAGGGDQGCL